MRRQVLHVALEVPLAALGVGGLFKGDHARAARVEVLHEALDGAALAGCIAAFEQDHDALAGFLGPGLQLEQLHLQTEFLLFVGAAAQQVLVGVAAFAPVIGQLLVRIDLARREGGVALQRLAQRALVVGRGAFDEGAQRLGALGGRAGRLRVNQALRGGNQRVLRSNSAFAGHEVFNVLALQRGRCVARSGGPHAGNAPGFCWPGCRRGFGGLGSDGSWPGLCGCGALGGPGCGLHRIFCRGGQDGLGLLGIVFCHRVNAPSCVEILNYVPVLGGMP